MNAVTHSPDLAAIERDLGAGFVKARELAFVRGEGARLWDAEGHSYLDFASAHGATSLGHAHPAVLGALHEQAARLISCTPSFASDVRAAYLTELMPHLPGDAERLFLCNSGTESVEAALKIARLATGRTGIVACMRGFHGRTLGALQTTWERRYRDPFAGWGPEVRHVRFGPADDLREAVTEDTAALILEVVQGEGGVRLAPETFLRAAELVCRERGAMLIVDEVQTGFGRTGRLFACEHAGIAPDLVCLAKGIAAGFPMGAVAIGPRVAELPPGSHGSTFGGSPLACAVARATLRTILDEGLVERAALLGNMFLDRLRGIVSARVREVRGLGLMVGVELRERAAPFLAALLERGVVALAAGPNVIRFLPPLVVSPADLDEVVDTLCEVLS